MLQDGLCPRKLLSLRSTKQMALAIACACVCANSLRAERPSTEAFWPQWRGPILTGVAPHGNPPVQWSESRNIRWKVEIPGHGHATPIVWGDRVYVQTAVKTDQKVEPQESAETPPPPRGEGRGRHGRGGMDSDTPTNLHKFAMLALDRRTGSTLWQTTLREELPHEGGHQDASQASSSPVTDGTHIFAYFGSRGLYCLDMRGNVLWEKELGKMQTRRGFGEGSSPTLHGDTLVVNWDHEGQSFLIALDKKTGEPRWKIDRDEPTSWATPLVVEHEGRPQVVISATGLIRSHDLANGKLLWQCGGMTKNVIPSPVSGNGLVYATSGFRGSALLAIRYAAAEGDITESAAVAWKYAEKGTPYVPSPLLYGDALYFLDTNRAILSCVDAVSGSPHYTKQRLEGMEGVYASPVGAGDRVYVVGRNGTTAVIKRGPQFELLAANTLDDSFSASPAIVDHEIYLRGRKHLYCIATD